MDGMSNSRQWKARVFVSPPTVPGQPVPKAVEVGERGFALPSTIDVDAIKREARARLDLGGYKLRSISIAAPLSSREVLVYLEERAST
jgi:hypothetical protein